jgi:hypothetical protein
MRHAALPLTGYRETGPSSVARLLRRVDELRESRDSKMEPAHAGCYGSYVASGVSRIIIFWKTRSRGCHEPVTLNVSSTLVFRKMEPAHAGCYLLLNGAIKKPRMAPGLG